MDGNSRPVQREVSIVLPTLNAEAYLPALLKAAFSQRLEPKEILVVDSGSTDGTLRIAATHERVRVVPIEDFSHGKARNIGAAAAGGEIVAYLSQDALPRNELWLSELVNPLGQERVAASYSRQIPRENASPMEQFFLLNRFPEEGVLREKPPGGGELGLEQVFFSNVSSAVKKEVLERFPFDEDLIMSEDQQLSRDLLDGGYAVVYAPQSVVIHSHDYSLTDVFRRYLDSVYSLQEIFSGHDMQASAAVGLSYLLKECRYIFGHHPKWIPYYILYTMAKSLGTLTGHWAGHIPRPVLKRISLHGSHWER